MKTVLIVSPHFPPVNAADVHRIRVAMPYLREFGWDAVVLAVQPDFVEGVREPLLEKSLPPDVSVVRTKALSIPWTRRLGIGNLGIRAFPFLYQAGREIIRKRNVDLVYFSTTVFTAMPLGRLWKRRFGIPFVLDMQDPWASDYYKTRPASERSPKYRAAERMHRILEPWTMKRVDGIVSVSRGYIRTLEDRYPWLAGKPTTVLPFGGAEEDFCAVRKQPQQNGFFDPHDGFIHGVYVGRGGHDMAHALRIIFRALKRGIETCPDLFSKVRLHFVGTDYACGDRARKTIEPVARECGVADRIQEWPLRIPYFQGLQLFLDSDFLVAPGSDDPQYTASKIYPYILARKPLLAVFHEASGVCDVLRATRAGELLSFNPEHPLETDIEHLLNIWSGILRKLPFKPLTDWTAFQPFTARRMAQSQCCLFDAVTQCKR